MLHRGVKQKDIFHEHKTQSRFKMLTCSHWAGGVYFVFAVVFEFYQHVAHVNYVRSPTAQGEGLVNGTRIGSLYIYIYILDKREGSTYTIISFDPTLEAARKTMAKTSEARKVYP